MNSFELNKVLGAILFTCLCLLAVNISAGAIFAPVKPAKPGYAIEVKAAPEAGEATAKKEPGKPIAELLASASVQKGQSTAKQCEACHTLTKGGPNRVGPNLWNIVGSPRGEDRGGFGFSDAMKKKGGKWTYDELDNFLKSPRSYIPGTKMTFAGLSRDSQRADVIAYLRTLSDSPAPLPKVAEGQPAPAAGAAPATKPGAPPAQAKPQQGKQQQQGGNAAPAPQPPAKPQSGNAGGQAPPKPQQQGKANAPAQQPAKPQQGNAGGPPTAPQGAAPPKQ